MNRTITRLALAAATAATLIAGPAVAAQAAPARATPRVAISEIFYNSPGSDNRSNASLNGEWVQLHNTTGHAITLTGWTVRDRSHHVFAFGTYRLRAHGYVKIHTGRGGATAANRYWGRRAYVWNNDGDKATVRTAAGVWVTGCHYSDPGEVRSSTHC